MYQKVTLIGRLGKDPQMKYTPDGTPVTTFSLATTRQIKRIEGKLGPQGWITSANGKHWELVTWWEVTCWRGLAETVNSYGKSGQLAFIEGEIGGDPVSGVLRVRVWTDKSGTPRASYEVTAQTVKFLSWPDDKPGQIEQDDMPF